MRQQTSFFTVLLIFIALVVLAAMLRFYHLGTWSFGLDEVCTQVETQLLFENRPIPDVLKNHPCNDSDLTKSQFYLLPRLVLAAYFIHWIDYRLFGCDEFGSRVLMAVMGSLCVGLAFLLGHSIIGFSGSLILAFLILLWPEHIFQSQNARFSIQSFLMIEIVFLLGGYVALNRSTAAAIGLGPAAVMMVLSHSLSGVIWGILLFGLMVDFLFAKRLDAEGKPFAAGIPWKIVFILGVWSVLLLLIAVFHILPIASTWNQHVSWRLSPKDSVLTFASDFGWAFFVLCLPAWFFILCRFREAGQSYWMFCCLACGTAVFLLPLKIAYNSWYSFLFAFPLLVVLASFMQYVGQLIARSDLRWGRCCALIGICAIFLFHFPVLNGYYKNGNRYDLRTACQHIRQHWQPGDQILCWDTMIEKVDWYVSDITQPSSLNPKKIGEQLQSISDKMKEKETNQERIWCILPRDGTSLPTAYHWFDKHAEYQTSFGQLRYDKPIFLDLFLCSPNRFESEPRW